MDDAEINRSLRFWVNAEELLIDRAMVELVRKPYTDGATS
jgi:hypothetical protein